MDTTELIRDWLSNWSITIFSNFYVSVRYIALIEKKKQETKTHEKKTKSFDDIVYVNLEPLIISLGPNANAEYLKITVSLETSKDHAKAAEHLQPHFRDVLNMYLRAVDEKDLVEPFAMTRLRAQMLRRMQTVASSDIVSDILITDFVLN